MRVLYLGKTGSPLIPFLQKEKEEVLITDAKISASFILDNKIEYIISYCYRHLIKKEILELLPQRVINLHISFLPFNKGADPNFWSFMDNTPKGISIHAIDKGLDTGDIIYQEQVKLSDSDNLKATYSILQNSIQNLFIQTWSDLKNQRFRLQQQTEKGTYHRSVDKEQYISGIKSKWMDMPICEMLEYINDLDMTSQFWDTYYKECKGI